MRVKDSLNPARQASRCLAGLLAVVISAGPVAGQAPGDPAAPSATTSAARSKKAGTHKAGTASSGKTAAGKTGAGKTGTAKAGVSHAKTAGRPGASRRRSKRRGTRAERSARTARIKKAFVASTELRPMAQQLATLRTPAAYAGVTSYAHRQTGDAAAAAYLALGHAYLLDKRYAEASSSLRQARQSSEGL